MAAPERADLFEAKLLAGSGLPHGATEHPGHLWDQVIDGEVGVADGGRFRRVAEQPLDRLDIDAWRSSRWTAWISTFGGGTRGLGNRRAGFVVACPTVISRSETPRSAEICATRVAGDIPRTTARPG